MRKIKKIEAVRAMAPPRKKVAAYARISLESERMNHSLSAQISYYNDFIQRNPEWEFAGVYADEGISGTSIKKRSGFQQMLADCEAGRIDMIITKSIQRFARNTLDLLRTIRHLKELGIEVWFEKENIHTLSGEGELMLSILASFAQEESRSISDNVKWAVRKRFEQGIPHGRFRIYGYRWEGDHLIVEPEEAKIVRMIIDDFLNGLSAKNIEKKLKEMGVTTLSGVHFCRTSIRRILDNITYTGNLLLQKEYRTDPITGKSQINRGELPQYWVEDTHEAVIPLETHKVVQEERKRRRELGIFAYPSINTTCFTSRIKCGSCGANYRHKCRRQKKDRDELYHLWVCNTYDKRRKAECTSKAIPENQLKKICTEVLGLTEFDEDTFLTRVEKIVVVGQDVLEFHFIDGRVLQKKWKSSARIDCWSEERRREWSERHKNKNTNPNKKHINAFAGFIKCGRCGANFQGQLNTYTDGTKERYWRCHAVCGNKAIKESTLKELVSEVLGLDEYAEDKMDEAMDKAVIADNKVTFHFKDEHTEIRRYKNTKRKQSRKEHGTAWKKEK